MSYGQPAWRYDELVAANLDTLAPRGLSGDKSPPGLGYKAPILAGDMLYIPENWRPCAPCGRRAPAPSLGITLSKDDLEKILTDFGKGQAQDTKLDPITIKILELVGQAMAGWQDPPGENALPEAWRPGMSNAVVSWWKRAHPNKTPTHVDIRPYTDSAAAFMARYGAKMAEPELIPWGRLNIPAILPVVDVIASDLIDWPSVRSWLFGSVPIEKLKTEPLDVSNYPTNANGWADSSMASIPWSLVEWPKIPFQLIPWGKTNWTAVRKAIAAKKSTAEVTFLVKRSLAAALGVDPPQQSQQEGGPPGGRPPGVQLPKGGGKLQLPGGGTSNQADPKKEKETGLGTLAKVAIGVVTIGAAAGGAVLLVGASKKGKNRA